MAKPSWGISGARYHLALLLYAFKLALRARRFAANLAIIDSGNTHFFALTFFRLLGVPVAFNLHNVLWPAGYEPIGLKGLIRKLNRWFFRNVVAGGIGCSPQCERQVLQEAGSRIPFFQYRCQFSKDGFQSSAEYSGGPFRIIYASRAEENKGLLDLIPIAAKLRSGGAPPVVFMSAATGRHWENWRRRLRRRAWTTGSSFMVGSNERNCSTFIRSRMRSSFPPAAHSRKACRWSVLRRCFQNFR